MATFTVEQVQNVQNSVLDFYMKKGQPLAQYIQDRPLLARMRAKQKTIPGGKGRVEMGVIMESQSHLEAFEYDDTVGYGNPAKNRKVSAPYRLFHIGTQVTMHELIHDGITVTDTVTGKNKEPVSQRDAISLWNIFDEKMRDQEEGFAADLNKKFWQDGTQGALEFPGITAWVTDNPTAATVVGGIDQAANPKWQNRANLAINLGASADTQAVIRTLDKEVPQLRRYGGKPSVAFAGSDMIDRLKAELRAKGTYTMTGFNKPIDVSAGAISFDGIGEIYYDPTLDDLGYSKRLYVLDESELYPFVVDGEDKKKHNPARPEDKYVFYSAYTWVGGMIARRRNGNGVYGF
jgi:hypothetical protein